MGLQLLHDDVEHLPDRCPTKLVTPSDFKYNQQKIQQNTSTRLFWTSALLRARAAKCLHKKVLKLHPSMLDTLHMKIQRHMASTVEPMLAGVGLGR